MTRILILGALGAMLSASPGQATDADRGAALFRRQCAACHQVTQARNGVGPSLQGVVGREAGSVAGANYSSALRQSGLTWTREELSSFLANPTAKVRGSRMSNRVPSEADRDDIIEYLAQNPSAP